MPAVHFSHVSFSYSTAVPIIDDASFDLGPGWAGLVGANGAGKTTLLSLITGDHPPDTGTVTLEPSGVPPVLCAQRVDTLTEQVASFASDWHRDAARMRGRLELDPSDLERWETLSPGERKRWQIGAALAGLPEVLLLDEPTNHLDAEARRLLESVLADFRGCGVIVSHDRTLLNDLTTSTLRVADGRIELRSGSYDTAKAAWLADAAERTARLQKLNAQQKKLARRLADQRRKAQQKDAERIRKRRAAGIHDLDTRGAIATGRHAAGQRAGSREREVTRSKLGAVAGEIASTAATRDVGGPIAFPGERADKEFLVRWSGSVVAGDTTLFDVDLGVRRDSRIRIAGRNGSGKSTLLGTLLHSSAIPSERTMVLPQESTAGDGERILGMIRALPPDSRGSIMSIVALLGSDPSTVLASDTPSPGETRKLILALGLGTPTWLLALDEPTNHLDLPSIERLQDALTHYRGAILMITHDDNLADAVTTEVWDVSTWR